MADYVDYFLNIYHKHRNKEVQLFGFSFGAMISFITSSKVNIKTQILCSVSPYYQEDMRLILKSWAKSVGKKRMQDFAKLSRTDICKNIKAKTIMLVGTKERNMMVNVSKSIYRDLKTDKNLIIIKGVGHDITNEKYLEEIKRQIALL